MVDSLLESSLESLLDLAEEVEALAEVLLDLINESNLTLSNNSRLA